MTMDAVDYLQKPSLMQSLDVSHIISKHFGQLFTADCVDPEIIENLTVSQGSTDEHHRNYVMQLINITNEREQLFERTKNLREHLYSARDQALQDDSKIETDNIEFSYLNLPSAESTFYNYIDNNILRENGLIAPEDVFLTLSLKDDRRAMESSSAFLEDDIVQNNTKEQKSRNPNSTTEFRLPPIEPQSSSGRNKKSKENRTKATDMILATDKEEDRHILGMMAFKNNYLKNPRHIVPSSKHQSKDWLIKVNDKEESPRMFIAIPEMIEFSDYETGKVYEKVINFRNVTSVLRSIRVLPPKSRYFSLGLGQFPGEKGLVAAGMSCQYAVRFSPDSLGDFEDEITVETQGENSFVVKLASRRTRPMLSGGPIWDIGYSLVFGLKVVHYTIKNNGGHGKFCLIDANLWPISNPKSFFSNKETILEPFILRPSHFELRPSETITLELLFCPLTLGVVERKFLVLCDNCHLQPFTIRGEGEIASIMFESIEDGLSNAEIGESSDISAQMLVRFGDLNPFTYCQKVMVLKNTSHTEVPFCWKIIKPNLQIPTATDEESSLNTLQNRTLDFDSAFLIEPPFGVFQPNDSLAFTITFAPLEVKENHSVLHLVLQGIPDIMVDQPSQPEIPNEALPKQRSMASVSEELYRDSQLKSVCLNDVTSLEIEVKGSCIPLDVSLNPLAIIIAGQLLIDTPVRRQLQICNKSMCPVNVNWKNSDSETHIFNVEPQVGMIEPGEIGIVDVCVVSSIPGFVRDTLICTVDNLDTPLELVVEANFKGPDIDIDQNNLDFGLVRVNESARRVLKIMNKTSINCRWMSRIGGSNDFDLLEEIKIVPKSGLLAPLQTQQIAVTLTSSCAKMITCGLEISLEHGSAKYLNVLACIQSPQVVLSNSNLDVSGKLFVNVPSTFDVTLRNQSNIASTFNWKPSIGQQSDSVVIFMDPFKGVIEPNSERTVKVTITCSDKVLLNDLIVPCAIEDQEEPILLQITGNVQGPNIICSIFETLEMSSPKAGNENLAINFGENVEIFQDVKRYISIENTTSIVTTFHVSIDNFKASSEDVEVFKDKTQIKPNLADRQSKPDKLAHYDFCKKMLSYKNGLAVGFNPSRGILAGYDRVLIEVTAYNDMWGDYLDAIRVSGEAQALKVEPIFIPVTITVRGMPIEFTMTSGRKEQKPILRLGSKPVGHEALRRRVRLNNKSPCDMYINWEMYSKVEDTDEKIIDLVVNCGDPFPILRPGNNDPDSSRYIDSTRFTDANDSLDSNSTRVITDRDQFLCKEYDQAQHRDSETDDQLISVVIRPHDGILSTMPISFDPPQLVIPSESYSFVTIKFDPRSLQEDKSAPWDHNNGISYDNYLLGFVSLQDSDLRRGDILLRKQQYAVEQVKLEITGRILRPSLQVEYEDVDEREEVQFNVPFSSLLNTNNTFSLSKLRTFTSCITLRNLKDTDIKFSLQIRSPFEITNSKLYENSMLEIGGVAKVEIKFSLDKKQLSLLKDHSLFENEDSKCLKLLKRPMLQSPDRTIKAVVFRDVISINYDSTPIDQIVPLRATINFPEFMLSKSKIDFATCFIGEACTEYFRIVNESESSSLVVLRLDKNPDSVFEVKQKECLIPCKQLDQADNHCYVAVSFRAKQAVTYSAVLVLTGIMGEEPFLLLVEGRGSYDNQYQRKT